MPSTVMPVSDSRSLDSQTVSVWDLGIRLFHWGLVATVSAALFTGFFAPEWWIDVHIAAGTAVASLVLFRLVLGFFGSPYARFSAFAYRPSEALAYLKSLIAGHPQHYRGHNPLGAVMVFGLLAVLVLLSVSGVVVLGGEEKRGPLAFLASFSLGDAFEELHELLAWIIVGMIGVHVGGVVFASWHERFNLVASMIHGRKPERVCADEQPPAKARPIKAMVTAACVLLLAGTVLMALSYLPAAGVPRTPIDPQYRTECGDCHIAFHPSLLPAASWRGVMASLDDHFGEDADLAGDTVAAIGAYLAAHASERFDTEAANRFRTIDSAAPTRITATPFWRRRHGGLADAVFNTRTVGARSACGACHHDAETGLFADAAIALPATPSDAKPNEDQSR